MPTRPPRQTPRTGLRLSEAELAQRQVDADKIREALDLFKKRIAAARTDDDAREITRSIAQIVRRYRVKYGVGLPDNPVEQAKQLDPVYVARPHLDLLSNRIVEAVQAVEDGENQMLAVSMPPRSGKSTLTSLYSPLWILRRRPEWDVVMTSYDGSLTTTWARQIRGYVESRPDLGMALARDGGAGGYWNTTEGGGMYAVGIGGALTGRGAKVLIIDDPVSDFTAAHSPRYREALWNWWLSVAQTRLEPPFLVLVVGTRWHEDDFIGRLLSDEYEGSPTDWQPIALPALADRPDDILGRAEGEPLISPLLDETPQEAKYRWALTREQVGTYTFEAMYQQHPAPARGAIFDAGWWRYWTTNPAHATADHQVVLVDPLDLVRGNWLDSWDCAFKSGTDTDYVVGQRWVRIGPYRYLIAQLRGRWSFTQTVERMKIWALPDDPALSPHGDLVHRRLIESAANGPAIIDTLRTEISGLKPINVRVSKESRARAITPEVESGHVLLPYPGDPGNEWVADLLSELRNFPHDLHDDQVDALTQALLELRDAGRGQITQPDATASGAGMPFDRGRNLAAAAWSDLRRPRGR